MKPKLLAFLKDTWVSFKKVCGECSIRETDLACMLGANAGNMLDEIDRLQGINAELLKAIKALANFQKGKEDWPEVKVADALIARLEEAT